MKNRLAAVKMSSAEAELGLAEQLELAKYQVLLLFRVLYSSGSALMDHGCTLFAKANYDIRLRNGRRKR